MTPFVLITKWNILSEHSLLECCLILVRWILTGNFFGASWFLVALMIGIPTIFYLSKWISNKWILAVTLLINILIVLQCGYGNGCKPIELFRKLMSYVIGTELEYTFLVSLFWIAVGKWFAEKNIRIKSIYLYIGLLSSMMCLFIENLFIDRNNLAFRHDLYISLIPLCVFLTLIVGGNKNNDKKCKGSTKSFNDTLLYTLYFKKFHTLPA